MHTKCGGRYREVASRMYCVLQFARTLVIGPEQLKDIRYSLILMKAGVGTTLTMLYRPA